MITIREISNEIGVSKTAVFKRIKDLGLQTRLQRDGNRFVLSQTDAEAVKSAFSAENANRKTQTETTTETTTDNGTQTMVIDILRQQVDDLRQQISAKDEQISQLQRLLDQQQQLTLLQQKKSSWWSRLLPHKTTD